MILWISCTPGHVPSRWVIDPLLRLRRGLLAEEHRRELRRVDEGQRGRLAVGLAGEERVAVAGAVGRGDAEVVGADRDRGVVLDLDVGDLPAVGVAGDLLVVAVGELDDHLVAAVLARDGGDRRVEPGDLGPGRLAGDGVRLVRGEDLDVAGLGDDVGGRDAGPLLAGLADAGDLGRALERQLDLGDLVAGEGHEDLVAGGGAGRDERRAVVGRGLLHAAVGVEEVAHHGGGGLQLLLGRGEQLAVQLGHDDELAVGLDGRGGEAHAVGVARHVDLDGHVLVVLGLGVGVDLRGEGRHARAVAVQGQGQEPGDGQHAAVAAAKAGGGGRDGGHGGVRVHGVDDLDTSHLVTHSYIKDQNGHL